MILDQIIASKIKWQAEKTHFLSGPRNNPPGSGVFVEGQTPNGVITRATLYTGSVF